ncbi:MAG: hypothetical protein ABIJ21_03450 [Nanoarchaeota archaeon]
MTQEILLRIVQSWNISADPEYRGFRCAHCQDYMKKAWHHWLNSGGYKTPVHFCKDCQAKYSSGELDVPTPTNTSQATIQKFTKKYLPTTEQTLIAIQEKWNLSEKPRFKAFACDLCREYLPEAKGYHTWFKHENTLIEEHFCRPCAEKIGIGFTKSTG